jgi:hypothetical protein
MPETIGQIQSNMKLLKFIRRWGMPLLIVLTMALWGLLTGWWTVAVITIILFLILTMFIKAKGRIIYPIVLLMVPVIHKKIQALQRFQKEAEEEVVKEVQRNEDFALFLVTDEQLFQGFDSEGKRISPPYTAFTRTIKRQKRQPTNRVTLLDTGVFYDSMFLLYGDKDFRVINIDEKSQKLRQKYGTDILGLNERSRDLLAQKIKPGLIEEFKTAINAI